MIAGPPSRPLMTLLGIPVSVNFSHGLLLLFIGWRALSTDVTLGLGVMAVLSFSILMHELGHGLLCALWRLEPHIILGGLGGVCRHRPTRSLNKRFWITLAGPAMNFALAGLMTLAVPYASGMLQGLLYQGAFWNVLLGVYNLLPVQPLDGGTIALIIAKRIWPRGERAERVSYRVGVVVAILVMLLGLWMRDQLVIFVMGFAAYNNWLGLKALGDSPAVHRDKPHASVRRLMEQAHAAFAQGRFKDAARLCHQARAEPLLSEEESQHSWKVLAMCAARQRQWEDAAKYAARVKAAPDMVKVEAIAILALSDTKLARQFLASERAVHASEPQLESLRALARSSP